MSFDTFKIILDKMPKTLTQIAFGVDAQAESNPDLWAMMKYTREQKIIPNLTVADIADSDEVAMNIARLAGACAVSRYEDKNICYNSIKKLTDLGMKQVNIHCMISEETFDRAIETMEDMKTDSRLKDMYAIVLLSLKKKGRGVGFTPLSQERFNVLCNKAHELKINFGFDSCGSSKYINFLNQSNFDEDYKKELIKSVEPCEITLFSSYANVYGQYSPCSFTEHEPLWEDGGIDIVSSEDFLKDVWNNDRTINFRNKLLSCRRNCILYKI